METETHENKTVDESMYPDVEQDEYVASESDPDKESTPDSDNGTNANAEDAASETGKAKDPGPMPEPDPYQTNSIWGRIKNLLKTAIYKVAEFVGTVVRTVVFGSAQPNVNFEKELREWMKAKELYDRETQEQEKRQNHEQAQTKSRTEHTQEEASPVEPKSPAQKYMEDRGITITKVEHRNQYIAEIPRKGLFGRSKPSVFKVIDDSIFTLPDSRSVEKALRKAEKKIDVVEKLAKKGWKITSVDDRRMYGNEVYTAFKKTDGSRKVLRSCFRFDEILTKSELDDLWKSEKADCTKEYDTLFKNEQYQQQKASSKQHEEHPAQEQESATSKEDVCPDEVGKQPNIAETLFTDIGPRETGSEKQEIDTNESSVKEQWQREREWIHEINKFLSKAEPLIGNETNATTTMQNINDVMHAVYAEKIKEDGVSSFTLQESAFLTITAASYVRQNGENAELKPGQKLAVVHVPMINDITYEITSEVSEKEGCINITFDCDGEKTVIKDVDLQHAADDFYNEYASAVENSTGRDVGDYLIVDVDIDKLDQNSMRMQPYTPSEQAEWSPEREEGYDDICSAIDERKAKTEEEKIDPALVAAMVAETGQPQYDNDDMSL